MSNRGEKREKVNVERSDAARVSTSMVQKERDRLLNETGQSLYCVPGEAEEADCSLLLRFSFRIPPGSCHQQRLRSGASEVGMQNFRGIPSTGRVRQEACLSARLSCLLHPLEPQSQALQLHHGSFVNGDLGTSTNRRFVPDGEKRLKLV